uniref:Uncharacterized protein n=1 Tax=viral metagenome TaxID=1070528 RepID=A0A6H1ZQL4_9ZZZZ
MSGKIVLSIYRFSDGCIIYFLGKDKKNHVIVPAECNFSPDFAGVRVSKVVTKSLKIPYSRWKKILE